MKPLFSNRENRALLLFLPLALALLLVVVFLRPKVGGEISVELPDQQENLASAADDCESDTVVLFRFDPNTIDFRGLRRLGFTQRQAVSLLKYRDAGKVFRIPEEITTCYGISDSLFFRLEPYIRIGSEYAITPRAYHPAGRTPRSFLPPGPFLIDTVSPHYLETVGLLTRGQARSVVRWRDLHGIRDMEDLRMCYVISDSLAEVLAPYVRFSGRPDPLSCPVEINRADSAALRSVYGIGEKSVKAILRYRGRLGGFCRVEQLSEIPEVTEQNYERILKQICCDSCEIQKIDINFASPNVLAGHPYMPPRMLRKLLKARQLKGGWANIGEMVNDHILTQEEAARLAPYLRFDTCKTYID